MDVGNAVHTASYIMLTVTWCSRSECCVLSGLDFEVSSSFVYLRALNHWKHDMGTLLWLNAETLRRAPTPLFGRLVRCSTHGHSFCETVVCMCTVLDILIIHANSLQ